MMKVTEATRQLKAHGWGDLDWDHAWRSRRNWWATAQTLNETGPYIVLTVKAHRTRKAALADLVTRVEAMEQK
jgi:hypothetical protein